MSVTIAVEPTTTNGRTVWQKDLHLEPGHYQVVGLVEGFLDLPEPLAKYVPRIERGSPFTITKAGTHRVDVGYEIKHKEAAKC